MSISKFYTRRVEVKGLAEVAGTDKETFQTKIGELACYIEPQGEESVMLADGAYYTNFKMWCRKIDIVTGDKIIDENDLVYIVKGVSLSRNAGVAGVNASHHLEVLLAVPI